MFSSTQLRTMSLATSVACGALICSGAIAGAPDLEVVAYTGLTNSPPNFPGLFWNNAQQTSNLLLDNSGQGTFSATIFGDGIIPANNKVQWYGSPSGWTNVLRNGDPAPGIGGVNLLVVQPFSITSNGTMAVSSTLKDGGVVTATDTAFWIGTPGNLTLVAREGTTLAPGGATMTTSMTLGTVWMNNAGNILFSSNLVNGDVVGTTNNLGVYLGSASGIVEVTRKGNPIPGAPALPAPDGPFMTPDASTFRLNGAGEVLGIGQLVVGSAGGVSVNDDAVVWTTVGGMRHVAREGSPVPGMTDVRYKVGSSFALATMGITNSGKVIYQATLENSGKGTSVTPANDTCWLVDDHGMVSVLVREDDPIDGELFNFAASGGGVMVTDDLVVLTGASKAASNSDRLWKGPIGGPYTKVVERLVTTAPGQPTVLLSFSNSQAAVALNSAGQFVFSSPLAGAGVTVGLDDSAIFGWDSTNGLTMIARKGVTSLPELLEVSQLALVGTAGATGDNGSNILTDNGWLAFKMTDVKGFTALVRTRPFDIACDADVTGNDVVDIDDLVQVITNWGDTGSNPADVNGDLIVNIDDLVAVITAWGNCP